MNGFPNRQTVERLREQFKPGVTVELIKMDDPFAPPVGTRGKCLGVDDAGSVMVAWNNGSGLSVAYGEDLCKVVKDND